ncbi:MAG: carboxymuconolactone decarboxylase family protein [Candidatus Krumholzibacteria bacterium]|jgi:AhpD family alkylhydroperoxidase|nr:carboxymuconolactone decarboxylase family protein [Candidatus Krumholzibacteria bacterium]MDP6669384.1 carboxymuconolactone decarboxylase family protein [Candidatus Krumholzibacteria bacterium]MDP6797202.1 carboxymuconolactone decarboxylase family protein [Candidatus Krumholzibacteria bacterium]MDP7022495.1 carboxymuconolactone decarboxylase family protein [Candidatus Krumholzibacteria bacterium]
MSRIREFDEFREKMNEIILGEKNRAITRMFGVDTLSYQDGALDRKTKEMLGLSASMVLRCDDCILYHLRNCHELGVSRAELFDIFSVSLTVGGTIVVPHLRRAVAVLEELENASRD